MLELECVRQMFWLTAVMHCDMFVFFPWRLSLNWEIRRIRHQQSPVYTVAHWSLMRDMLCSLRRMNFIATSGQSLIQITTPSCSGGLPWLERQGDWGSAVRMFVSLLLTRRTSTVRWQELFCSMVRSCFFLRRNFPACRFLLGIKYSRWKSPRRRKFYTAHFVKFCLVLNSLSEVQRPLQKYSEKWPCTSFMGWLFPCLMLLSSHTCASCLWQKGSFPLVASSWKSLKSGCFFSSLLAYHPQQKFCKAFVALVQVFCLKIMLSLVTVQLPCLMCQEIASRL